MRIFIGIELDDAVKSHVMAASATLRSRVDLPARWVPVENLHITLWFIGQVDATAGTAVLTAMSPAFGVQRFPMELGGFGVFPRSGPPRALWMGVRDGFESVSALHREISSRLSALGFEPERRPYSAHLTLARIKTASGGPHGQLRATARETSSVPVRADVTAVTVFESRVSAKGAAYLPLLRVPLV